MRILGITLCCLGGVATVATASAPFVYPGFKKWLETTKTPGGQNDASSIDNASVIQANQQQENSICSKAVTSTCSTSDDETLKLCKTSSNTSGSECHKCVGWWNASIP